MRSRYSRTKSRCQRERVRVRGTDQKCRAAVIALERKVGSGLHRLAHVAISGIADYADDLVMNALAFAQHFVEPPADSAAAGQILMDECLIDQGCGRLHIAGTKIPALEQRNFHYCPPFRRDVEEVRFDGRWRGAID